MAGFSSMDDFINETTVNGKFSRSDWNKNVLPTTAQVAGMWHDLSTGAGNPSSDTGYGAGSGTNLSFQSLTDQSTLSPGIQHGGNVSPDTKHIVNASAFSAAATSMPAVFMLVDRIGYYGMTTTTLTTNQVLINSITFTANAGTDVITTTGYDIASLTRVQLTTTTTLPAGLSLATDYWTIRTSGTTSTLAASLANAIAGVPIIDITDTGVGTHTITAFYDRQTSVLGAGLKAYVVVSSGAAVTAMGAGTPNISFTYTRPDTGGTDTGRVTPVVLPVGLTAAPKGTIPYSGTGVGRYGPFMPFQAADNGIESAQNFQISATYTSGNLNLVICRPLLTLPMTTIGVAAERDLLNQVPSLPRVYDGANLTWLMYAGAATPVNSAFFGHLDFAWG